MKRQKKCSECGTAENVKPAREYPELAALLKQWGSLERLDSALLCPKCAQAVCRDLRGETVRVYPLDLSKPEGQDPEAK